MAIAIKIPLSRPDITAAEKRAVLRVLETPTLSLGPKLKEFEEKMARFAQRRYAVGVNSGTSALHLIVRSLGIGKEDEVITTPFSFIASANCILYEEAEPVFADIEEESFNIDPKEIVKKITKKTKAILTVDVFGYPAQWNEILRIAKKYKLKVIEDSAEAIGAEYKEKRCGGFGDASMFSFYPNKQITTGEGGVVLTDDKKIAELCRSMANQGREAKKGKWLEHVRLGYNYRLSEMQAVLGIAQMTRVREILQKRKRAAQLYNKKLKDVKGIELPLESTEAERSWFVYVIKLSRKYSKAQRDKIVRFMAKKGIQCGIYFTSIHLQPFYKKEFGYKKGDFPLTESVSSRTIALPFFSNITEKEINIVVRQFKEALVKI